MFAKNTTVLQSTCHYDFHPIDEAKFSLGIEGFTVADAMLVVGQTRQNLQCIYGKNRDFDAR